MRWNMLAPLVAAAVSAGAVAAPQSSAKSTNDGVYTTEQADRGARFFESRCTACHDTARFTGAIFLDSWTNQPLNALFELMQATMPEDNPGSLRPQQYADVLTFLLSLNGFPTGATELEATPEALAAVQFLAPAAGAAEQPAPGTADSSDQGDVTTAGVRTTSVRSRYLYRWPPDSTIVKNAVSR